MKKFLNVFIIVLLIGSIGFNIFLILNNIKTTKKYDDAVIENESLAQEKSDLKSDLMGAEGRFNVLQEKYDELYENYDVLLDFYNENYVPEPEEPKNLDGYRKDVTFDDLSRKPNEYKGEYICYTGEVVQLLEKESENNLRIAIDGDYNKIIYVGYFPSTINERVLEGDKITIYGQYLGIIQYDSVMTTVSIPGIWVEHIEIHK